MKKFALMFAILIATTAFATEPKEGQVFDAVITYTPASQREIPFKSVDGKISGVAKVGYHFWQVIKGAKYPLSVSVEVTDKWTNDSGTHIRYKIIGGK